MGWFRNSERSRDDARALAAMRELIALVSIEWRARYELGMVREKPGLEEIGAYVGSYLGLTLPVSPVLMTLPVKVLWWAVFDGIVLSKTLDDAYLADLKRTIKTQFKGLI